MCRLRHGVPEAMSSPAGFSVRLFHGPYRVRSNWSRPSWYSSPRECRVSQRGDCTPVLPYRLRCTAMFRPRSARVRRDTSAGMPRERWYARVWGSAATNT